MVSSDPSIPAGCIKLVLHKKNHDIHMGLNCIRIDLRICWVLDRLAPYKLPRALDSLLLYQQPSSTTLYYSYPGIFALIKVRLRNETGKLHAPKGTCCPSSALSFPEDCARLKLSSARASQAGLKEMMTRRRVRG